MLYFPAPGARKGNGSACKGLQVLLVPGVLSRVHVRNNAAEDRHLQFHDAATAPADTAVPAYPAITIPAGTVYESETPRTFSVGCYVCLSSTVLTKTLVAADDAVITAETN
jgi:hypothetical protein